MVEHWSPKPKIKVRFLSSSFTLMRGIVAEWLKVIVC
jgi:hypothetical protein